MRTQLLMCVLAALWLTGCSAESVQAQFDLEVAFPNLRFTRPVDLQHPGDGTDRLFVVEQPGVIRVFTNDPAATSAATFLDIEDRVRDAGNEEGLLGLAFHPNYAANGFFYIYYSASSPRRSVVARYRVDAGDPNKADRDSEVIVLEVPQPFGNHNGGQIAFGPNDGFLYIALGDGGSGGDPQEHGQNPRTLLGAILRLDVDNPTGDLGYGIPADNPFVGNTTGAREEIWAYGLRNPWRFSFDAPTGQLWTGDVGQGAREEIDLIERGGNYGWNTMEGFRCFDPATGCNETGLTLPIVDYGRNDGQSVTGGYVYRGAAVPELAGQYIYGDFVSGRIWALDYDGQEVRSNTELLNTSLGIAAFGIDRNNELYLCAFDGRLYRFMPTVGTALGAAEVPDAAARLSSTHPNPFRSSTIITYALDRAASVELAIYDLQGRLIRTLEAGRRQAGEHQIRWDGRTEAGLRPAGGVYMVRLLVAGAVAATRQLVLTR